jgi:alkylhydroperoxidase/carboxymuconolactone decarboxylase family protein YurZ
MPPATLEFETAQDIAQSCERLFRPIARLALENGLPMEELEAAVRQVILQEAKAAAGWTQRYSRMHRLYGTLS